ncbi:hypothetical protein F0U44_00885 [Nocardioides humilatus]|uniref:Uncharacterized protein n=1 Tax=Nocardioides humilatus TaxID=2607660 RepID=A0A5B1LK52_9ACTN|nr:hypothetical protein [Nocardioides humilatus]KAA1420933.1 hypothetical protein F0U44_00885 [Nocardioides humilatus]
MNLQLAPTLRRSSVLAVSLIAAAAGLAVTAAPAQAAKEFTTITVTCSESIQEGHSGLCAFNVFGDTAPTGTVKISSSKPGGLSWSTCELQVITPTESTCGVVYTPQGEGSATRRDKITGKYTGDSTHRPTSYTSFNYAYINVPPRRETHLYLLTCGYSVPAGGETLCTMILSVDGDDPGHPTGTVKFKFPRQFGLPGPTCDVVTVPDPSIVGCTVHYTPFGNGSNSRQDTITAYYSGDPDHRPLKASVKVKVIGNPDD